MNVIFRFPGLAVQQKCQLGLTVLSSLMFQWLSAQDITVSGTVTGNSEPLTGSKTRRIFFMPEEM